jgi:serine/threonine-protein kinase
VPPALARAVERCLEKDPERRFASVAELARELAPFGSEPGRAMLARIEASAGPRREAFETTGAPAITPPPVMRTGSAWGANSLHVPRGRRVTWVVGGAGVLVAVVLVTALLLRHRTTGAPVVSNAPVPETPLAATAAPHAGPALEPLPDVPDPLSPAPSASSTVSASGSSSAAVRPHAPRPAHPVPPPAVPAPSPSQPAPAAPAATDNTPPGWTSGRKD